MTAQKARENVIEEYGDVLDCIDVWITPTENHRAMEARHNKFIRWAKRLQERSKYNNTSAYDNICDNDWK